MRFFWSIISVRSMCCFCNKKTYFCEIHFIVNVFAFQLFTTIDHFGQGWRLHRKKNLENNGRQVTVLCVVYSSTRLSRHSSGGQKAGVRLPGL